MERAPSPLVPRVALARESLWMLQAPRDASERPGAHDGRGQPVLSAYSVYTDAVDARDFESYALPVLRSLASSRSRTLLTLIESPTTFDMGRVRCVMQWAGEIGVPTMVEIRGAWGNTLLELLAAARPTYVRLAPEFVHGAGTVPEVFREMASIGEFARTRGVELVVRNARDEEELDAARVAGVSFVQWANVPLFDAEDEGRARLALHH